MDKKLRPGAQNSGQIAWNVELMSVFLTEIENIFVAFLPIALFSDITITVVTLMNYISMSTLIYHLNI